MKAFEGEPLKLSAFGADRSFERYLSNHQGNRHTEFAVLKEDTPPQSQDHFAVVDRLLARAKHDVPSEAFVAGMQRLCKKYIPDIDSVT